MSCGALSNGLTVDARPHANATLAEEKHTNDLLTSIADGGVKESATERPKAAE